jgi:hypothetical protein
MTEASGVAGANVPPARHEPKPLGETPGAHVAAFVQAGKQNRLVLYAGAGLSAAEPSCGPNGSVVAERLRPFVARVLGVNESDLEELRLEELADRIEQEAAGNLADLKRRAAEAFDFRGIEPNFGHEVAALLLREGFIELISVNWDTGVERAGMRIDTRIAGVATPTQRLQLANELPVYKVHGCAERPETLALTKGEIDQPQTWAEAEVHSALTGGLVVFVGLGLWACTCMNRSGSFSTFGVMTPPLPWWTGR